MEQRRICASLEQEENCPYAKVVCEKEKHHVYCTHPEAKRQRIGKVENDFPRYAPGDCPYLKQMKQGTVQQEEVAEVKEVEKKKSFWSMLKEFFKK